MSVELADAGRRFARVSPQRWSLSFAALLAAAIAPVATGLAGDSLSLFAIVLVIALAALTVVRPGADTAVAVLIAVVWYWLAAVDDTTSPWVLAVAGALFAFHTIVALLATTAPTATIDRASMRRWAVRSAPVAAAIVASWLAVVAFDRGSNPGSVWLTALALVVAAALAAALRTALPHRAE